MYKLHSYLKEKKMSDLTEYIGQTDYAWIDRVLWYFDPTDDIFEIYKVSVVGMLLKNSHLDTAYTYLFNFIEFKSKWKI